MLQPKKAATLLNINIVIVSELVTDLFNPCFTKDFTASDCKQIKWIQKTKVSCDVTGGITLGTKLKMPIFTLY